jgi:hypothetical protein
MARGAKPGERRGGRVKGQKNRATIEKERIAAEIAARTVADARLSGKKLAKEVLEEFMLLFGGMAAHHQPTPPNRPSNPHASKDDFLRYATLAIDCARYLAPYQSPTFRAVHITAPAGVPLEHAKTIEGDKVTRLDDPAALAGVYRRLVMASKG